MVFSLIVSKRILLNFIEDGHAGEKLTWNPIIPSQNTNVESTNYILYITQKIDIFAYYSANSDFGKKLQ